MLGMRGRWSDSLDGITKLIDRGTELMMASISYVKGELTTTTAKLSESLKKLDQVLDQETELKKMEARRIELEIKKLEEQLHIHDHSADNK